LIPCRADPYVVAVERYFDLLGEGGSVMATMSESIGSGVAVGAFPRRVARSFAAVVLAGVLSAATATSVARAAPVDCFRSVLLAGAAWAGVVLAGGATYASMGAAAGAILSTTAIASVETANAVQDCTG
jgi:hypothetical protein